MPYTSSDDESGPQEDWPARDEAMHEVFADEERWAEVLGTLDEELPFGEDDPEPEETERFFFIISRVAPGGNLFQVTHGLARCVVASCVPLYRCTWKWPPFDRLGNACRPREQETWSGSSTSSDMNPRMSTRSMNGIAHHCTMHASRCASPLLVYARAGVPLFKAADAH